MRFLVLISGALPGFGMVRTLFVMHFCAVEKRNWRLRLIWVFHEIASF